MAEEIEKKNINDLDESATTSNSDTLMVGESGTNTLKRVTLSTLFESIKSLITSWTFSALNTTSKVLTGAINEVLSSLNTLTTRLSRRTSSGSYTGNIDDLYNESNAGGYWCNPSNCTGTMPFETWFDLDVFLSDSGLVQRAVRFDTGDIKFRTHHNDQWYDWTEDYVTAAQVAKNFAIETLTVTGVTCESGKSETLEIDAAKSGYKLLAAWFRGATERRLLCVSIRVMTSSDQINVVLHVLASSADVTDRNDVSIQALYVKEN